MGKKQIKIVPLADRVLVKTKEVDTEKHKKTETGIYIPENSATKEKPEQGIVVAVGEGKYEDGKLIPIKVKVGDTVIFSKYGYDEIMIEEEKYLVIKEENILAVLK